MKQDKKRKRTFSKHNNFQRIITLSIYNFDEENGRFRGQSKEIEFIIVIIQFVYFLLLEKFSFA